MASVTGGVIQVDEAKIRGYVEGVVRDGVEATLNGLLNAEEVRDVQMERA